MASPKVPGILLEDDLFRIRAEGRLVWCHLLIPPGLPPMRGAKAAELISEYLLREVLRKGSSWLGLVLDVTRGPSVVGPNTLRVVEGLFRAAEDARKPLAMLLGSTATQRAQFEIVARDCAPRYAQLVDNAEAARDWMSSTR